MLVLSKTRDFSQSTNLAHSIPSRFVWIWRKLSQKSDKVYQGIQKSKHGLVSAPPNGHCMLNNGSLFLSFAMIKKEDKESWELISRILRNNIIEKWLLFYCYELVLTSTIIGMGYLGKLKNRARIITDNSNLKMEKVWSTDQNLH